MISYDSYVRAYDRAQSSNNNASGALATYRDRVPPFDYEIHSTLNSNADDVEKIQQLLEYHENISLPLHEYHAYGCSNYDPDEWRFRESGYRWHWSKKADYLSEVLEQSQEIKDGLKLILDQILNPVIVIDFTVSRRSRRVRTSPEAATTFTCFGLLPLELRRLIWDFYGCDRELEGRVQTVHLCGRLPMYKELVPETKEEFIETVLERKQLGFYLKKRRVPKILHICQESRNQYIFKTGRVFAFGGYINFQKDVIRLILGKIGDITVDYDTDLLKLIVSLFLISENTKEIQKLAFSAGFGTILSDVHQYTENDIGIYNDPIKELQIAFPKLRELIFLTKPNWKTPMLALKRDQYGYWDLTAKYKRNNIDVSSAKRWLRECYTEGWWGRHIWLKEAFSARIRYVTSGKGHQGPWSKGIHG